MTTLDEYLTAQRGRSAGYQRAFRERKKATLEGAQELRSKNAEYQRAYRERLKSDPQALARHRAKSAEHQRVYRERKQAQAWEALHRQIAEHAQRILAHRTAHPGATMQDMCDALGLAYDEYARAMLTLQSPTK